MIDRTDQIHHRMDAIPGHTGRKIQDGINRIEQRAVPVVFENAPAAFNGIVLAVVRRVIHQSHYDAILLYELDQTPHKLGAPTVVFGAVIQIDDQRSDLGKAVTYVLPPRANGPTLTVALASMEIRKTVGAASAAAFI